MSGMLKFGLSFGKFLIKRNLQHLIAHVTNHCNFRCQHCFIDFSPKKDLKLAQFEKIGRDVGRLFWLDIGGGEPFLRKDLAEIVGSFRAQIVQIPSNGSLPDSMEVQLKRMRKLTDAEITVSLSLDGLKDTHERIRGAKGNWDQVWSTFERLRALGGFSVKINTVITNENKNELLDLMREVRHREPDFHSIILLRGDPMDPQTKLPSTDELRRLGPEIFSILETYDYGQNALAAGILRNYHKFLWNVSLRTTDEQRQVIPCLAGRAHMVMMGNGDVSSCEMLDPVGNIQTQTWAEITKSPRFKQQVQDIKDGKCHCTHNCAMLDSILLNPANFPNLLYQRVR
jgi:MoaA/NifB/PqqE/SkfB family radical SAM enzyme